MEGKEEGIGGREVEVKGKGLGGREGNRWNGREWMFFLGGRNVWREDLSGREKEGWKDGWMGKV